MQLTLRQYLTSLAAASLPASVVYVLAGYWFIPGVSAETSLTAFFFVFFFFIWLFASVVLGFVAWFVSFRRHFSWKRLAVFPLLFSAFLLWPGINGDMAFTRTLPVPLALATLLVAASLIGSRLGQRHAQGESREAV